jgi:uncharacterized protein (DUF4415 family)
MVSIRLDIDVLCALRASGARWQTRLNAIVRDYVERLHRESPHER